MKYFLLFTLTTAIFSSCSVANLPRANKGSEFYEFSDRRNTAITKDHNYVGRAGNITVFSTKISDQAKNEATYTVVLLISTDQSRFYANLDKDEVEPMINALKKMETDVNSDINNLYEVTYKNRTDMVFHVYYYPVNRRWAGTITSTYHNTIDNTFTVNSAGFSPNYVKALISLLQEAKSKIPN